MISKTKRNTGTTLVELMIAVALIGIISLGVIGSFGTMAKAIQASKSKTLASNLAQEQMQILKQKSFNRVLVTTATVYIPGFSPGIPYDPGYYPPENILEGSITFQRYTHVQIVDENSGALQYFSGSMADTGMKALTVTVTWTEGTVQKKVQVKNILANIDTTATTAIFRGRVTYSTNTSVGIPGAMVTVAENVGWQDFVDASGNYQINLNPGSYRMIASARGFFPQYVMASVGANATATQNFALDAMASGSVRGSVWINDHPVISQVVGSSVNPSGFCQEFIEVFNPSTFTWNVASNATTSLIDLKYQWNTDASPRTITMTYVSTHIPPSSYYLFANTPTVVYANQIRTADAVFNNTNANYPDMFQTRPSMFSACGVVTPSPTNVGLTYAGSTQWLDLFGWTRDGNNPPQYETTAFMQFGGGFQDGQEYVRKASTNGISVGLGRAYDSGTNNNDFGSNNPGSQMVHTSASTETVVSGVPAIGAIVSANDGLSQSANATATGSPPAAVFHLASVATGTWTVIVSSGAAELEISSVVVTANTSSWILNSVTYPNWSASGYHAVVLTTTPTQGVVAGWVRDALGAAISVPASGIPVTALSATANANTTTGNYFLRLATGTYDVSANAGNISSSYVSLTSAAVVVSLGVVTSDVNFTLSQGGRIRGFVTRDGINALPGVSVIANDVNEVTRDQEVSGSNGQFLLINLSTGQYTVEPVLGSGESASPSSATCTVTAGATISVGTFTITGAYGSIRGTVASGGAPIRTGVLIVCSTATITGSPPTINFNSLTGAGYFMTNSYEDGTFAMDVLGSTSTTYKVYAYYTTFTGSVSSTTLRSQTGITVTAGQTTSGINLSW